MLDASKVGWSQLRARERRIAKYLARGLSDAEIVEETGRLYRLSAVARVTRMLMDHTNSPTRDALLTWIAENRPNPEPPQSTR